MNQPAMNEILEDIRAMENDLQNLIAHFMRNLKTNEPIYSVNNHHLIPHGYSELYEQAAKSFKESARQSRDVYYDEASDNQLKAAYYHDLSLDPSNGELLANLTGLITTTHKNQLPYSQSKRELHSWVDLHEDGKARSIYSGKSMEADTLLVQDLIYEAAVRKELTKHTGPTSESLESILAALALNVEHVIPQSWFKKASPMVGDLHHLFTCEMTCNSFRSNIPYYDFDDYRPSAKKEMIRNDCGKRDGEERFEPQNGKGAVARASLYFLTRYPSILPQDRLQSIDIPMLLKWHQDDPVALYEKHRNWAIYQLQGNRNPFIDFPDTANILINR
ncbi:endonuclease I family protein [Pradoshia sp.]